MRNPPEWAVELDAFGKSRAGGWPKRPRWVLRDVTLRVARGQILGLLGPNGAGKSTTLKAVAGLVAPGAGACRVLGHPAGSAAARAAVGFLPEALVVPPHLSGREWLAFFAALEGVSAVRIEELLAWADLQSAADAPVATYSKGMKQRLGLAQTILPDPAVVLLDEPANGLDAEARRRLARLIRDLAERGRTVVFSSHLLASIETLCDRVALLGAGRLLAEGRPRDLLGARWSPAEVESPLEALYREKLNALA